MCNCSANLTEDPWHCLDCTHNQHLATRRHTRVVDILTGFIKGVRGGGRGTVTQSAEVPGTATRRIADMMVLGAGGRRTYVDVSMVNTCANTAMDFASGTEALEARRTLKMLTYEGCTEDMGRIMPFVVATTGKMDVEAVRYGLEFLQSNNPTKHFRKTKCFTEISVAVAQCNARMLIACTQRAAVATQRG